jgi:hypothetical protein
MNMYLGQTGHRCIYRGSKCGYMPRGGRFLSTLAFRTGIDVANLWVNAALPLGETRRALHVTLGASFLVRSRIRRSQ